MGNYGVMSSFEVKLWSVTLLVFVFLFGLLVGSFLNVVIFRVPREESVSKERSHCMSCGYQLAWYDLIPLFSWLALKGKCRKCGAKISVQYPLVEAGNAILWLVCFISVIGTNAYEMFENPRLEALLYCLMTSALLSLSIIDFRTFIIPPGINYFIGVLGVINIVYRILRFGFYGANISLYIGGFFAVSVPLLIILLISEHVFGREAIGGGDIKLMAVAGLLIGWKKILLALVLGCLLGSIIHTARMKIAKADRVLAFGPYLAMGIFISALWGEKIINWYFGFFPKK